MIWFSLFCLHMFACCVEAHGPPIDLLIHEPNDRPHHVRKHNLHRPPYKRYDWYIHYRKDERPDEPPTRKSHDRLPGTTAADLTGAVVGDKQKATQLEELETSARLNKVEQWKEQLAAAPVLGEQETLRILFEIEQLAKTILEARKIVKRRSKHHRRRRHH
ncbi:uncharacterized protein DMAD_11425 [Drosophila madeirensis]|uniref:Uncharacterized protein n=1 Tax=Drosophila madeirensis TaxID=30013 RepID=A0AAU9FDB5_DROMD